MAQYVSRFSLKLNIVKPDWMLLDAKSGKTTESCELYRNGSIFDGKNK